MIINSDVNTAYHDIDIIMTSLACNLMIDDRCHMVLAYCTVYIIMYVCSVPVFMYM